MASIEEARLTLRFGDGWSAVKWDAVPGKDPPPHPYREGIEKLNGRLDGRSESSKAVDVVAASPSPLLVLIEIKDFRTVHGSDGHAGALAFGGRWQELPLEIALKVRDTIAGIYGVVQRNNPEAVAAWCRGALGKDIKVVALVLQDTERPREPRSKRAARDSEMLTSLRRHLAWLTTRRNDIAVIDRLDGPFPPWLDELSITST